MVTLTHAAIVKLTALTLTTVTLLLTTLTVTLMLMLTVAPQNWWNPGSSRPSTSS